MSPRETPASISALRLCVSTALTPHCAAAGEAAASAASAANFMLILVIAETPTRHAPAAGPSNASRRHMLRLGPATHLNPCLKRFGPEPLRQELGPMNKFFTACAARISTIAGQPVAFVLALSLIILWG